MWDVVLLGAAVLVAGVFVILLATVLASRAGGRTEGDEGGKTTVKGGGVVMIGPIPIIFGTDAKWAVIAILLAIALVVLGLLASGGLRA